VNTPWRAIPVFLAISAGAPLRAQTAGLALSESSIPAVWNRGFGLHRDGEALWGIGPGYKARFDETGVEFTPVMGPSAPRSFPLAFALESVRRGDALIYAAPPEGIAPVEDGLLACYDRGTFVERYEACPEGIEQSFRFDSLPPGTGDLVVRGRVTTDLLAPAVDSASEGIRFEAGDVGGVSFGSVTGIDAAGNRTAGWLRFDGTHLDLVLPEWFVDAAVLPLVLDPLIGPTVPIPGGYDLDPDVAYDATVGVYLVVWERTIAATVHDVMGQRFSSTGALLGSPFPIVTSLFSALDPAVANVAGSDRFLVAWRYVSPSGSTLQVRAVDASNGSASNLLNLPDLGVTGVDVGGYTGGNPLYATTAIVVYSDSIGIRYREVNVPPSGAIAATLPSSITMNPNDKAPAITKHGGLAGRFLVVWDRPTFSNGSRDIYYQIVTIGGTVLGSGSALAVTLDDEENADCAAKDDSHFLVVYEKQPGGTTGHNDIACKALYLPPAGTGLVTPESLLASGSSFDQVSPAVDFAQTKYLVAYATRIMLGSASFNIFAMGVDPDGCVPCEPAVAVDTSSTIDNFPRIASRFSGGSPADEAMLVWQSVSATDGEVKTQRLEAIGAGGAVVDLGGGCGAGGTITVNGPVALGNSSFAYGLSGAAGPPVALVLSPTLANFSCGPCTLRPGLDVILAVPAPFLSPTPCNLALYGATLYAQWIVATPGGCPIAPPLALSSAISVTIGT